MTKGLSIFLLLLLMINLSSCTYSYQVSALYAYNGPQLPKRNNCFVVRTSLSQTFSSLIDENKKFILGDSHVETAGSYANIEAAYDCMSIGAKSVLVLNRGVISSSTDYVPLGTSYNYYAYTNTVTSTNYGYYETTNTSAYVVVFFSNKISARGSYISYSMYKEWAKENHVF